MGNIVVQAPRVRKGQPVTSEIVARYVDDGHGLPFLVVLSAWSPGTCQYRRKSVFRCEEVPTPLGRGFILHRSEQDIALDGPDADTTYEVLVAGNGQDHTCSCRGFSAHGYCRHHDAVRAVLEAGHIDRPEADRPADSRPEVAPF